MENTVKINVMETSAVDEFNKGSRLLSPQIGESGWHPAEKGEGETPLVGGETRLPAIQARRIWRAWRIGWELLASEPQVRIDVVLLRSGRGRPGSRRLLRWTLAAANTGLLLATSRMVCRSLAHLGSSGTSPQRVGGSQLSQASDNVRPEHSRGAQAERAKQGGQILRQDPRVGLRVTVVSKYYLESKISKANLTDIQRAIGRLEHPE